MSIESIGRRDFLKLRTRGSQKVLELSCEHLYMQWVDAQSASARSGEADARELWQGEPPTHVRTANVTDILDRLERRLSTVDVLRVHNAEWLTERKFRLAVDQTIERFRQRGGQVERGSADAGGDS